MSHINNLHRFTKYVFLVLLSSGQSIIFLLDSYFLIRSFLCCLMLFIYSVIVSWFDFPILILLVIYHEETKPSKYRELRLVTKLSSHWPRWPRQSSDTGTQLFTQTSPT